MNECNPFSPALNQATRRYNRRFLTTMVIYAVSIILAAEWARHGHRSGYSAYAIAALPGLTVVAALAIIGLYLKEEKDEFNRATQVEALLWATGITLAIETTWGFLENFTDAPHAPLYLGFALFCGIWGVANLFVRRRYQ
jgi:chromate transport protein ChrA